MATQETAGMIEAHAPVAKVRRAYDLMSYFYGGLVEPLERRARMLGLDQAAVRPGESVLEVAVGPGAAFVELLRRAGPGAAVAGVDLSPRMIERARQRAARAGWTTVDLRQADARRLPFADGSFDLLFNSYMLDLIPLGELPSVLGEFWRVLKPGGRLALVNLSKRSADRRTAWERIYQRLPRRLVPYLAGGCRPVIMAAGVTHAGFQDVRRQYVSGLIPSEIVVARKPVAAA